jgi:ADP-ribose pyrophosphatase
MRKRVHTQGIKKQTDNSYLNMYEIDAVGRDGRHFPYYMATRREPGDLMYETGSLRTDGVVIYPVYQSEPGKLVLLRQFRYPVNAYVYEVPAGLVDEGEEPETAAIREMKEETGLDFEPYRGGDISLSRPFVQSQGMSDECNITIFGYASGEISTAGAEEREDIRVLLADREEAVRILREEIVSIRAAYLLLQFIHSDPADPFAFLRF